MQSKIVIGIVLLMMTLGLLPFALVARSRAHPSPNSSIHLVFDMDNQPRYNAQAASPVFADGRAMRPHIDGTVAREDLQILPEELNDPENPHLIDMGPDSNHWLSDPTVFAAMTLGRNRPANMTDDQFAAALPITATNPKATDTDVAGDTFYVHAIPAQFPVSSDYIHRGQERFNIYCAPCHGQSGYGDGMVENRVEFLKSGPDAGTVGGWVKPQNLHEAKILARPDGNLFNTITNGARTMPPYDKQISVSDRWAIVAYVRALQLSQNAPSTALTPQESQIITGH